MSPSPEAPKVCFDRAAVIGPEGPVNLGRSRQSANRGLPAVVNDARTKWPNGATIRVRFLDGNADQRTYISRVASQWTLHANLTFTFCDDEDAEIQVSLDPAGGAWSRVGNLAEEADPGEPTLNLGWLDDGVVLHEFGHAIGLGHEHMNPLGGLVWNEEVVLEWFAGPPNEWDEETTRRNVLEPYARSDFFLGTEYDPSSIMVYAIPAAWLAHGEAVARTTRLSDGDIAFISGPDGYPR
jgi:hypothetical protein